jgi:NAD(P)-dependent dehydrogenase (short-subunit alcohol dehydrogenase family)
LIEEDTMRIAVIDGQGGGIGKSIVEKLRQDLGQNIEIIALGTNSLATSAMLKAGADECATGENAILYNSFKVDIIAGSIGIIAANSMLGELTPAMAKAIAESPARKILIPLNRCNLYIAGSKNKTLPQYIDELVEAVRAYML